MKTRRMSAGGQYDVVRYINIKHEPRSHKKRLYVTGGGKGVGVKGSKLQWGR